MSFLTSLFKSEAPENKFADLHIHTTFSDGLLTPEQVVVKAKENGLGVVAIVDHDAVGGIEPAMQEGKQHSVEVIPAVELSCIVGDNDIHIIGYYINYRKKDLIEVLTRIQNKRLERAKAMVKKLAEQGAEVEIERVLELAGSGTVGRPHIAQALLEEGHISSYDEAFWKYIGYHCPAYVPKEKLTPKEAMKLISDFHGISVLAHPMSYNNRSTINYLIDQGIRGLEVWRPDQSENDTRYLSNLVQMHNLLSTGGTDCHGGRKGKILIGEIKVPYQYVQALKRAC
jgi:predicted metal-dependent phosphoesterase TrpH